MTQTNFLNADAMESSIVGAKGQVVIPKKIRSVFHIKTGTRVHFEARDGAIVLTLRLAPRPSLDFARDRLAVGSLRIPPPKIGSCHRI